MPYERCRYRCLGFQFVTSTIEQAENLIETSDPMDCSRSMFNIVQAKVTKEEIYRLMESRKDSVRHLMDTADQYEIYAGHWMSRPMATTSPQYFAVEQAMRSLFGDPKYLFVDLTGNYELLRTRAPQNYDYSYVIEVAKMQGEFGEERLVAIPHESVEYQSGRYSSGMFTPIKCIIFNMKYSEASYEDALRRCKPRGDSAVAVAHFLISKED